MICALVRRAIVTAVALATTAVAVGTLAADREARVAILRDDVAVYVGRAPRSTSSEPALSPSTLLRINSAKGRASPVNSGAAKAAPTQPGALRRTQGKLAVPHASPEHLAGLLRQAGVDVRLLTAEELADPQLLNRQSLDLVVLPYGATFPLAAHSAFQAFLAQGGDFISVGGYAFDNLVVRGPRGWLTQSEAAAAQQESVPVGGNFEGAPWDTDTPASCAVVADEAHSGKRSVRVSVEPGAALLGGGCHHDVAVEPGQEYVFTGWIKAGNLGREADGFAYLAVYQYAADGRLVIFRDTAHMTAPQDWQRYDWRFRVAPEVARARLIAGLYNTSGSAWFDDLELVRVPAVVVMNTRTGEPRDGLVVTPQQIGVFDPSYTLERVAYGRGSADGFVFPSGVRIEGPLEGYAASGVVGWDQARWTPLVNAYDRYGRLRGAAGALVRNYAGAYARSSWAFFGVTNRDLFPAGEREMGRGFVRLVRLMLAETYLHNLATDRACYHQGEPVAITVRVSNFGRRPRAVKVRFDIEPWRVTAPGARCVRRAELSRPPREVAPAIASGGQVPAPAEVARSVAAGAPVAAGETVVIETAWRPGAFAAGAPVAADFYRVRATLSLDGEPVDRMETAFSVSDPQAVAAGPAVRFAGNYVEADGARHFLLGTDTYANMFSAAAQDPLTWARDLGAMRDNGVTVYENLQFHPAAFAQPYVADDRVIRQVQGMVQIAQQLRLIYVPGLLIGWETAADDEQLERQAGWCESFAEMLSGTPGVIYYTNGDLRLKIEDTPQMRALYAGFLRERYGVADALQEAWGAAPPITSFDQAELTPVVSRGWDDLRVRDRKLFEQWLVRRWLTAMHDALKQGDGNRPTTVEFYGQPYGGVDIRASLGPIDIGNMGYFGLKGSDIEEFPARFKFSDMRAYGQGLSIGEFGAKTHPAWAAVCDYHQTRTEQEQLDLYLAVPHYALGLGGCKVHNWCWADADESVFPWGLVHSNDRVPKRVLSVYRNTALLFKHFEPLYREPAAWVVVPTSHRTGSDGDQVYQAVQRCIDGLVGAHVDFGVIDEDRVAEALPESARVLFWPLPYCPSDEAVAAVEAFVARGGCAYVSGDFSFDPNRKRTRSERLERLAGVRFVGEGSEGLVLPGGEAPQARVDGEGWFGLYDWRGWPAINIEETDAQVIARGPAREPRLVVNHIGEGTVVYTPDALEADVGGMPVLRDLYRAVLGFAGIARLQVRPDAPDIHVFEVPTRAGGAAYVLFNPDPVRDRRVTLRTPRHEYALTLGPHKPGFILEDAAGHTLAAEASGTLLRDGRGVARGDVHFMLATEDGQDLAESSALLFMPAGEGQVRLSCPGLRAGAAAQVGEVVGGRWTPFETVAATAQPGVCDLSIDADRAVSLLIIGARADLTRIGARVASTLTEP